MLVVQFRVQFRGTYRAQSSVYGVAEARIATSTIPSVVRPVIGGKHVGIKSMEYEVLRRVRNRGCCLPPDTSFRFGTVVPWWQQGRSLH